MGWGWSFAMMPYGDFWRAHRRLFHKEFDGPALKRHHPHQTRVVNNLLRQLLDSPARWNEHLRQYVSRL